MAERGLTPKQAAFVKEYLIDLNALAAYRRAGYQGDDNVCGVEGHRLLSNPKVAAAIQAEMDKRSKRTEITADYVLESIVSTMERCKQVEPVFDRKGEHRVMVETPDGAGAQAFTFNAAGVLKGAELLGKHLKLFTDRVEHSGVVATVQADLSEDEVWNVLGDRVGEALNRFMMSKQATAGQERRQTQH